jgi:hypothetical protein
MIDSFNDSPRSPRLPAHRASIESTPAIAG